MTWEFVGVEVAFANGFDAVEYQPDKITQGLVEYAHTVGIEVNCGLVTDEKEQNRLFGMGVDHILI
jgi:EAL domain-containing protein (putative c-di-GMP-specific phosphodiesterase class I)